MLTKLSTTMSQTIVQHLFELSVIIKLYFYLFTFLDSLEVGNVKFVVV